MLFFYLQEINFALALGGLALLTATMLLYVDFFVYKGKYFAAKLRRCLWYIPMFITVTSVALSLLYSEYFGFVPCSLCWLQRIAIYPQALLSIMALKVRDTVYFPLYGIGLSIFGFLVAAYQYMYQMIPKEKLESGVLPCLVDGSGADCAEKIINEFGFVTFPFISAVTLAFLIVVYLYLRKFGEVKRG